MFDDFFFPFQDEMKMERLVKRNTEMETCCNNIKLLTEMLNHYGPSSPAQDKELMKVQCSLFFLFSIYVPHLVVTNVFKRCTM